MRKKKNNTWNAYIFNQYTIGITGIVLLIFISIPLSKNLSKRYEINSEIRELENEIAKMENKNSELANLIDYLSSNQFVMEQARLNLNYKQEGEEIVVVKNLDEEKTESEATSQSPVYQVRGLENQPAPKKDTNPIKWWNHFFN